MSAFEPEEDGTDYGAAMSEQTSDLPVLASMRWKCDECGASDVLHLARKVDVPGLVARLKIQHRQLSPDCPKADKGPTGVAQIDVPEDAVVNDPREVREPIGKQSGKVSRLLAAVVGAIAAPIADADAALAGRETTPRKINDDPPPAPSAYAPEARAAAREEHRARNAQSRLQAAEAKRKRKAARRGGR
jgi:hypothetical protein